MVHTKNCKQAYTHAHTHAHTYTHAYTHTPTHNQVGKEEFKTVSDKLSSTMVRKKNLQASSTHEVRVRAKKGDVWGDFSDAVSLTTLAPDVKRIPTPEVYYAPSVCL
jgi:hypothetical protein